MNKPRCLLTDLLFGAMLVGILFVTGCQNHIRNIDTTAQEYDRSLLKENFILKPYEHNREEGKMTMQVYGNKVTSVKLYENHRTLMQSTPYECWREIYEVPMGVVVFPIGIVSHVLNVVSLGIFPYRWCWAMDCFGLAALNPFMNVEDADRIKDEALKNYRELADQREENEEMLLSNFEVTATVGDKKFTQKTDERGLVTFNLLAYDGVNMLDDTSEQQIILSAGESNPTTYSWIVPRTLVKRVNLAAAAIKEYQAEPSGKKLAETVVYLENEGFPELAYYFQKTEVNKNRLDEQFMEEFKKADNGSTPKK